MTIHTTDQHRSVNDFDADRFQTEYLFWAQHRPIESLVAGIKGLIDPDSVVLDAGCGDGRLAVALAPFAKHVVGLDLSPTMIGLAKQRACMADAGNVQFLVGDIGNLAFKPATFDLLVSSFALHETPVTTTLPNLTDLLRPGGWFFAQDTLGPANARLRPLWYRWLALRQLPTMIQQHGVCVALRIFRFQQSRAWIEHQVDDAHWSLEMWQATLKHVLPGVAVRQPKSADCMIAFWQRPGIALKKTTLLETGPRKREKPSPTGNEQFLVQRTYPKTAPVDHVPFPREAIEGSVVERFEMHVRRNPAQIALRTSSAEWSYDALNAAANRVGHTILAQCGTGRTPVALLMDQDDPSIPALMGVLKAGRPYVFLDPNDPSTRWEKILSLTGAELLITAASRMPALTRINAGSCTHLVYEEIDAGPTPDNLDLGIGPDHLAAIFFTSGSTGEPKGVARDHRQFLHSTWLNTNTYFIAPSDHQSQLYFPGFTASVPNIYDTLLNGATLCSLNPQRITPSNLLSWLRTERITHFNPPVGLWRGFLEAVQPGTAWPHLRLITLAGQSIYGNDVREFQSRFGSDTVLLSVLAMTEAGAVTQSYLDHTTIAGDGPVPAGYPVADKDITILDATGQPVGPGQVGRIAITSAYLSLGYWKDEAQTQAHYRPLADDPRRKTFQTSDRGLLRDDGCLEYFGREDSVVKVRGYRVDVSAVEAVFNSHPSVQSAAVIAGEWRGRELALAAYIVPRAANTPTMADLRAFVSSKLPAYMVPDHLLFQNTLPLTPSGKIDRRALPAPEGLRPDLRTSFVAPRNAMETQLAEIWTTLLELNEVGVEDDFFELGGDSLLAMRMALAVEQAFDRPVSADFFRQPTVAHLAQALTDETDMRCAELADAEPRSPARQTQQNTRLVRQRLRGIVSTGPLWRGHGLPYGLGVRLHRMMVAHPLTRRHFAARLPLVQQWSEELGIGADREEMNTICLLANTWWDWRAQALTHPEAFGQWLKINDPNHYLRHAPESGGLVLAVPHAGSLGSALLKIYERSGHETAAVTNARWLGWNDGTEDWKQRQTKARAKMIVQAQQVLLRGGVVLIAADGLHGQQAIEVPFWGRRRPFQIGAAELAVTTGAAFVPVFIRFDIEGRAWVEVTTALTAEGATPKAQIMALTRRYGKDYSARWPQFYASMAWRHLEYNLSLPRM